MDNKTIAAINRLRAERLCQLLDRAKERRTAGPRRDAQETIALIRLGVKTAEQSSEQPFIARHRPDLQSGYSWVVFFGDTPVCGEFDGDLLAYTARDHAFRAVENLNRP